MDRERFERFSSWLGECPENSISGELDSALCNDPAVAEELLRIAFEESVLRDWARTRRRSIELDESISGEEQFPPNLFTRRTNRIRPWLALASCLALVMIAMQLWLVPGQTAPVAELKQIKGQVDLVHTNGTSELAAEGRAIYSGEEIRIPGPQDMATVVFPDESKLVLAGQCHVQLEGKYGKKIRVQKGQIGATISRQPPGQKVQIVTQTARIEVIGTQFSLDASAKETDVSVLDGHVMLTRNHDGRSIELLAGSRAVAGTDAAELSAQKLVTPELLFDVDFEQGLPTGWQAGTLTEEGEPKRGGVRAEEFSERDGVVYGITSQKAWQNGLFSIQGGEHLNITYKLDKPDWFQIFLSTRSTGKDLPPIATYRFKDERLWWPFDAGQWRTVSIPLDTFGRVSDWSETPLSASELPFELVITSKDNNLSLMIDRIWVSPDGPGTFTVRSEE